MRFSLFALLFSFTILLVSCGSETTYEEVELPTQGLITTLQEVETDKFLIEDETEIPNYENSLVIAKYMSDTIPADTFTLAEVKLMQETTHTSSPRMSSMLGAVALGYFGYSMLRNFSGPRPSPAAYRNQNAYNKSTAASSKVRQTATKTKRPSSGKSGYGSKSKSSGGSTRSYGG